MKRSEMNVHQKAMFDLMAEIMEEYIGGYENVLLDYSEEEEEYERAKAFLGMGHDKMKEFFYNEVMLACKSGTYASHARFAGGDFLRERIERRMVKWGY